MENLSKITGKLQTDVEGLSHYIELNTNVAGVISFDMPEACTLRSSIESLQRNIDTLKREVIELDKIQSYNKSSENFEEPEDRGIKGKTPNSSEKTDDDMVNHPKHYHTSNIEGKSFECIEVMETVKGWYNTAIFCELNAFKYNWRLGRKDLIPQEIGKIKWYSEKAMQLWKDNLTWFYPKNQHTYAIIDEIRMKNPTTGEWSDAILYTDGKETYARNNLDFTNKFKKK